MKYRMMSWLAKWLLRFSRWAIGPVRFDAELRSWPIMNGPNANVAREWIARNL